MRFAAIEAIYEAALKNQNIYFITGDLGHAYEEEFKQNLSKQYLNTGLSEQNMIGVAAGLALTGKKVFAYSIVPFVTMRGYEQIKTDICYQNLDVNLIGIGGGFAYGKFGNTHCSIEDIAVMRVLPNMKVLCPANPKDTKDLTRQIIERSGPSYIRIGRGKEPLPTTPFKVSFGKGHIVRKGTDISIFSCGTALIEAEKAAETLERRGISVEVVHMHTVKPLDEKLIVEKVKKRKAIFTVEDHNIMGGLGGAVAEIISEHSTKKIVFKRFGVKDKYMKFIGDEDFMRNMHGYSAAKISRYIFNTLSQP